jgi:hypothetical protein
LSFPARLAQYGKAFLPNRLTSTLAEERNYPEMRISKLLVLVAILVAAFTINAAPLVLATDALNTTVAINVLPRYNIDGGGGFDATILSQGVVLWCVDNERFIDRPDLYQADIVIIDSGLAGDTTLLNHVRNGNLPPASFADSFSGGPYSATERYQAAAYLLSTNLVPPTGGPLPAGLVYGTPAEVTMQHAIWDLTSTGAGATYGGAAATLAQSALSYINANPTYGFDTWAIVSGAVKDGEFSKAARQTFLVQLGKGEERVPEPGTYAMLGLGLTGLWALRRRKA